MILNFFGRKPITVSSVLRYRLVMQPPQKQPEQACRAAHAGRAWFSSYESRAIIGNPMSACHTSAAVYRQLVHSHMNVTRILLHELMRIDLVN
jgi:hypothetical protein